VFISVTRCVHPNAVRTAVARRRVLRPFGVIIRRRERQRSESKNVTTIARACREAAWVVATVVRRLLIGTKIKRCRRRPSYNAIGNHQRRRRPCHERRYYDGLQLSYFARFSRPSCRRAERENNATSVRVLSCRSSIYIYIYLAATTTAFAVV